MHKRISMEAYLWENHNYLSDVLHYSRVLNVVAVEEGVFYGPQWTLRLFIHML